MHSILSKIIRFIPSISLLILLCACSNQEKDGTIIVATSADNPPYEFMQNGQIVGADIDIIKHIVEIIEQPITIQNLDFAGLMQSLSAGNIDLAIAALSVTEARSKHVDFSTPYLRTKMALMYKKDKMVASNEELADKVIGAQLGSTWENSARILQGRTPTMSIRSLNNNLVLVEELKNDMIDAMILEEAQAKKFMQNNLQFTYRILDEFISEFAIALPKGSALLPQINQAIKTLQQNGTIASINDKWLNDNGK